MPTTRRKINQAARAQPTLSFNSRAAKVTKPSASSSKSSKAPKNTKLSDVLSTDSVATPSPAQDALVDLEEDGKAEGETTSELAMKEQVTTEKKQESSEAEERARGISDAQVKRYWKGKEEGRKAPRVHQQGLSLEDKILREFDLSYHYGPSIGIPRTKRWKRAAALNLNPPIEVLAVLLKQDAKKAGSMQRSQVDELMRSKFITNEGGLGVGS
ncbi:hypothetical protein MMC30_003716 [Trapelia coarctata]|nr:hypothetical protein [Trapelia coarctata]